MKKCIFFLFLSILFSNSCTTAQKLSATINLEPLCKKGANIYIISEIPDSVAKYPFVKEFSKHFNENGYWKTTQKIEEADLVLCFRGSPVITFNPCLYCYAIVFDNNFNFLYRTKSYCSFAGWKDCTEVYNKPFCKDIINDIKKGAKLKKNTKKSVIKTGVFETNYLKGIESMQNYSYKNAIENFEKCIDADPEQWQLYKILGVCNGEIENYKSAIEYFDKYLEYNPMDYDLDLLYGSYMGLKIQKKIAKSLRISQILSLGTVALNGALNIYAVSTSTGNIPAVEKSYPMQNSSQQYSSGLVKQECSFCHGTGYNLGKERPSFYSYNEDPMTGNCDVCADRSQHYHKSCPSCMGKGYILRHK